MLFGKNIEPRCVYCVHKSELDDNTGLCDIRGPVNLNFHCRKFRYDPLKRIPPKNLSDSELPVYNSGFDDKEHNG